jgi:hypothetical protein
MFFVAIKTNQGKLTAISHGPIKSQINFPDDLDCILRAHNLTGFSKIYFTIFDFYYKYNQFVWQTWHDIDQSFLKALDDCFNYVHSAFPSCLVVFIFVLGLLIRLFFHIFQFILFYHGLMVPFHLLAIPFDFFLFKNNFNLFGIISKNFIYFWIFPYIFYSIFSTCYSRVMESRQNTTQIKPVETMWVVKYLLQRKKTSEMYQSEFDLGLILFIMFFAGFLCSLPFLPLLMD